MCNKFDVIKDVIAKKTGANEMFTAYDITAAARKQEGEFIDKHSKIKRDIHAAFANNEMPTLYVRTLVGLEDKVGKFTEVFMYHDLSSNPTDYQPADKDIKVVSLDGDAVDVDDDDDETEDDDEVDSSGLKATQEGRLNIPKDVIEKVDSRPFTGGIDVSVDGNLRCVTINKDGRIRITVGKGSYSAEADTTKNMIVVKTL